MSQDLRKLSDVELEQAIVGARSAFWPVLKAKFPMSWAEGLALLPEGQTLDLLERESKRRRAATTRARRAAELAAAAELAVGQRVEVFSFGRWYPGEVLQVGSSQVLARYTTGTGQTRDKSFPRLKVRAAES